MTSGFSVFQLIGDEVDPKQYAQDMVAEAHRSIKGYTLPVFSFGEPVVYWMFNELGAFVRMDIPVEVRDA